MGAKLDRIGADLEKARRKRAEWDARVKDLERRYREEENSEIHEMVHAANLTPDQLSELLRMFAADKSYYYIADDDSIEVGDYVIVPAGKDNHEATVEVVKKEYFAADEVPLPMEKTKHIIRKCTKDDFDLPKE